MWCGKLVWIYISTYYPSNIKYAIIFNCLMAKLCSWYMSRGLKKASKWFLKVKVALNLFEMKTVSQVIFYDSLSPSVNRGVVSNLKTERLNCTDANQSIKNWHRNKETEPKPNKFGSDLGCVNANPNRIIIYMTRR